MLEHIIRFSLRNKLIIILFTLTTVIFGLFSIPQIPIGALPDVTNNQVQMIITSRNLSIRDEKKDRMTTSPKGDRVCAATGPEYHDSRERWHPVTVDSVTEEIRLFRQWEVERVPEMKMMLGKVNPAIIPTEKKNEWWRCRHDRKLKEIQGSKKKVQLVFLGNSITHNLEKPDNKEIWDRYFSRYGFLNLGFGGDRTENVLWRVMHGELEGLQPELLVLLIGTNNTDAEHYPAIHTGEQVAEGIARICYEVQQRLPATKILILAIFPYGKDPANTRRAANDRANRLASRLADGKRIFFADLNRYFLDPDNSVDISLMPDHLHPSRAGNRVWAAALAPVVEEILHGGGSHYGAPRVQGPMKMLYKKVDSTELYLYLYYPPDFHPGEIRPAIIFFFGGGWRSGSPSQFTEQARYLARRGMIALTADYRVERRNHTTPFEAVMDAKSAIRYVRRHAVLLGIDAGKIVASGGSAGGHVAAAAGIVPRLEQPGEDTTISSRPNALVLFNPVFNNGPGEYGYNRIGDRYPKISPYHNIAPGDPPTILFFGTQDKLVSVPTIKAFQQKMQENGNRCELFLYEGQGHGFFNSWHPEFFQSTMRETVRFLQSLGYLSEE